MNTPTKQKLGKVLWDIADQLRGSMNADDFRDYMLSFLFLRYLSDNYEKKAKAELKDDYPSNENCPNLLPLKIYYQNNPDNIENFENHMREMLHYVIKADYLWNNIYELARNKDTKLLSTLQKCFKYIENKSFHNDFSGLFSEINLKSEKLGKNYTERNNKLCEIITKIGMGIAEFSTNTDNLGDAYEYLIGQFAAGSGKKAGEFYTLQEVSTILSKIVTLDSQDPTIGKKQSLDKVLDFACGSGSLLLNIRKQMADGKIGKIYGQEKNITTFNLARMNMLLHGLKVSQFDIFKGDTLTNDWGIFRKKTPVKKLEFDAVVTNPPFSLRWIPKNYSSRDSRFTGYGLAPKLAADFAFLLHGLYFLKKDGVMAIILPHGVLFRKGVEERIRTKLLKRGFIDTVIGLPANLFYSTGIPVCILVLKKCKKTKDVLFINASESFEKRKGNNKNHLRPQDIEKIVETYQFRKEEDSYSRRVKMPEIRENNYNLNITRYVSINEPKTKINLDENYKNLAKAEKKIKKHERKHNAFLKKLRLKKL